MADSTMRRRTVMALLALVTLISMIACLTGCAANVQASGGAEGAQGGAEGAQAQASAEEGAQASAGEGAQASAGEGAVGIIGAMDVEVESLKAAAGAEKTTSVAGMDFCEGLLGAKRVVIVKCGMGKVNAGICANTLINDLGCTEIINTGVAGSLDDQIGIGDIVVSTDAVQHDFDVQTLGFAKGEIPYTGLYAFPADEALRKAAVEAVREAAPDVRAFEGRVCSGDQFITTAQQRDAITSSFGGMCCEMEGGAIAQACHLSGVPFVVIRAISDKPSETEVVDYKAFEAAAATRCAAIVEHMVEGLG